MRRPGDRRQDPGPGDPVPPGRSVLGLTLLHAHDNPAAVRRRGANRCSPGLKRPRKVLDGSYDDGHTAGPHWGSGTHSSIWRLDLYRSSNSGNGGITCRLGERHSACCADTEGPHVLLDRAVHLVSRLLQYVSAGGAVTRRGCERTHGRHGRRIRDRRRPAREQREHEPRRIRTGGADRQPADDQRRRLARPQRRGQRRRHEHRRHLPVRRTPPTRATTAPTPAATRKTTPATGTTSTAPARTPRPTSSTSWPTRTVVGNSAFAYLGAERIVNNGTMVVDFELNKKPFKVYPAVGRPSPTAPPATC